MPSFNRNLTAAQTIIDVMKGMGLTAPTVIASSQDPTVVQLWALATEVGQQLLPKYNWQFIGNEFTITTVPGTPNYALPADFDSFISDAAWNRTTRMPAVGNLHDYEWQALKARTVTGVTFTMLFRIDDSQVVFYDTPTAIQSVVFAYNSRGWVSTAGSLARKDQLTADDDTILYDTQLFKEFLKLKWRAEKGFDVTRQQAVADEMLNEAKGKDTPGRTLSLAPSRGYPYISVMNVPDSGYGA